MSESFSVGEIAITQNAPAWAAHLDGIEVEIVSPLAYREWFCTGNYKDCAGDAYECRFPDGGVMVMRPKFLRKRRPPQDWGKLCRLTDLPREVEHV